MPKKIKTPEVYTCPLTGRLIDEPSFGKDGKIYSEKAVNAHDNIQKAKSNLAIFMSIEIMNKVNEEMLMKFKNDIADFIEKSEACSFDEFFSAIASRDVKKLNDLKYLDIYLTGQYGDKGVITDEMKEWLIKQESIANDKMNSATKSPLQNNSHFAKQEPTKNDDQLQDVKRCHV